MVCISVDRKDLQKVCSGKEFKASRKTVVTKENNTQGLMRIFNKIINRRYLDRKRRL